jgi:aryl-alcohol dehydrogenase-like predicted oxidoreductase
VEYGRVPGLSDRLPRLIMGSVAFSAMPFDEVAALLDAYVAAGGTAVESAHDYGRGETERIIGRWLAASRALGRVMVMTKGAQHDRDLVRRVTPEAIARDLEESLERLGVDTIDLYMLHRDDPSRPVGPIVECLHGHAEAGRVRAYGGSNWTHRRLDEVNAYAAAHGLRPFVVSSPNLALAVPKEPLWHEVLSITGDREALAWYQERQFPLIPWSSQARGFFSGRFSPEDTSDADVARVYYTAENWERLRRAREAAARHGCTPTQIALAWVLRQDFPTFPLIGPRSVAELRDCLGALDVRLTAEEAAWLNLES